MASTRQSAVDYLKNARKYLVGKLKNLSVILDNLNQENSKQQRVLIDAAVRRIQAERDDDDKTRELLDSVIKQGEAACCEFLRVIYLTRKRTLDVDMHHWIIGFPFNEDTQMDINYLQGSTPCHRYQAKLKSKARKLSDNFWTANKNLFKDNNKPHLTYMPLVLDTQGRLSPSKIKKLKSKKSKLSRRKKLRNYIPEDRGESLPSNLLKRPENILLVGKPGIGKTALAHEMLKLWADRDNTELDYMFYFDMRETAHIRKDVGLEELLFNVFSEPEQSKDEVLQDIKNNSDNVTLIFDGITDLSSSAVKSLVENDLLPDAKIILTCRPDDEEDLSSEDFLRVEVKGFSEQTIETYLSAMLGEEQENVLRNVELLTLCHVPMYALMVAACFSYETLDDCQQPCTMTEIHINIVRHCLQVHSNNTRNKYLNSFISNKREKLLSLAEVAFHATEGKTVNLTECHYEDSCVLSFLKPLFIKVAPTETVTTYAFLHYTMQEFFAALWLVKNPGKIKDFFQQCLTEEKKHMKHLIPFMCRLLNEKSPSLMKYLIPAEELKSTSNWFLEEMINTFSPHLCNKDEADAEDSGLDVDILFLCQCLYESQCPEACLHLLHKLDCHLDLSRESLDPYPCCAVTYVLTQLKEKKLRVNLEDVIVSEQGMRRLFGCLKNAQWYGYDPLQQLWEVFLLSEGKIDHLSLLGLEENELHLPVDGKPKLFERAVKLVQKIKVKVNVCLYWERETPVCHPLHKSLLEALPYIRSLSFRKTCRGSEQQDQEQCHGTLQEEQMRLLLDLCLEAAHHKAGRFHNVVHTLFSLFPSKTGLHNAFLDLYQRVKNEGLLDLDVLSKLRQIFRFLPAFWTINLSEQKTSILLGVLTLQSEKIKVKITGFTYEESEAMCFLKGLSYISQLSFVPLSEPSEEIRFFANLFCAAAKREQQTGEKIRELLSSLCRYKTRPLKEKWLDFLLDLYSELETGLHDLPSLQSVFQSAPAVCAVNLSKRKASILLKVLKLQTEKKQVELTGWSDQESEMRSFLQCLPYISKLSFVPLSIPSEEIRFFANLFCAAAKREQQTGETILELLSSLCRYETRPLKSQLFDFLLDLYSELETGLHDLPSLQSVFQLAPAVCAVNLSKRKASILLKVLKLQTEKKQVELIGCSHQESEMRSFLQCLPYISKLSVPCSSFDPRTAEFFGSLFCAAAETEQHTGEEILELLSSVCTYETFPLNDQHIGDGLGRRYRCDFLLDLYSHLKDYETKTGLRVLPSVQSVFQSAPAVWIIDLDEQETSILLEVLKFQSEKRQVELRGCSYEKSEAMCFLQCLPYISKLSFVPLSEPSEEIRFFANLFCAAAKREQQTGEKILELLSSLCSYETRPLKEKWLDFLLDLYSELETGLHDLPSLQSVFQLAPAVCAVNFSKRKTSILLKVLKLQTEKKQVELIGCSDQESEMRSFLQCLPYISKLSVSFWSFDPRTAEFFGSLFCAAAETEQHTGEEILELLSSVCTYETFPFNVQYIGDGLRRKYRCDFLLDLYSHLKDYETKTGLRVLPSVRSVFQSAPAVWIIDLDKQKTSILLEVLKFQSEKRQVELRGCSYEKSEAMCFLQCLPYISKLGFVPLSEPSGEIRFFANLFCAAAKREQQTGEKILELLSSLCSYETRPLKEKWLDFLLDLYSELETGLHDLPSLQSVFQLAPAVCAVNLSKRKASILLKVLKLQTEKKQVELTGCSDQESEMRSFLQCLPYISKLSVSFWSFDQRTAEFFGSLFCAAAETEQHTGEEILELLSSVCTYETFPFHDQHIGDGLGRKYRCDFLLDLYSHLKDYETKIGLHVLPSVQSVFHSAPAVWIIDLDKQKTSILLEVLKFQSEKRQVELRGCSYEESEVMCFLQCLPYISKLSVSCWAFDPRTAEFFGSLFCAAAETEQHTGEEILELLSSVCTYETFPFNDQYIDDDVWQKYRCDFLLDLCSHLKDYVTKTGLRVLPSVQSLFQSAPAVWIIDLDEQKTSILLEVLKFQSEKRQVKLIDCSYEKSEVMCFLQCLPYISKLSVPCSSFDPRTAEFFGSLFCAAAETEQHTGEEILELLSSVCTYETFPFNDQHIDDDDDDDYRLRFQCDFLLDLCSHLKDYETKTGLHVIPSVQSVFQSAPAVCAVNLSKRKASILLEVLKFQSEKRQVELRGCSYEKGEVICFLQCLPYISKLSVSFWPHKSEFFGSLFCAAAETEQHTGEKILELLSSVCTYETFPFIDQYLDDELLMYQVDFLLDLYSHLKDYETKTGLRVLPSVQSLFQSAPAVWIVDLDEQKTSIHLEVLKFQSEKRQVKLRGCSYEESEVMCFLQCLPYISKLSCDPKFFQTVCKIMPRRSTKTLKQLASLLQLLGFTLLLEGALCKKTCLSVRSVLELCGSDVDLILQTTETSFREASLLFSCPTQLSSLMLPLYMASLLCEWVEKRRVACPVTIQELSLFPQTAQPLEHALSRVVSGLPSLLRCWTIRRLLLTEFCVPAQSLIPLLLHDGPLTIKLSEDTVLQLLKLLHENQDRDLTRSFLSKVGGDLTSCCLTWELLHYLLQQSSAHTITVDLKKNSFLKENITRLLPFLDRIVFKRLCPSFVLTAIREIHKARDSPRVPSLLRSLDHVICLTCREMDSVDCAALLFTVQHSDKVKLNLMWVSIPAGEMKSIFLMLDKVSQLSVDRKLLLRLVHCCAYPNAQQGAEVALLRSLEHTLDLSSCSCVNLSDEDLSETLGLSADDCRAISTILRHSSNQDTQLILKDCEVEDSGLDLLFPVLDRVRLRASKAVLLQLVSLVPVNTERDSVRRAVSLCRALNAELDLSHSTLDQRTLDALALVLDFSTELKELDLSHCQLRDQQLFTLGPQLHKVQVLDLSHNNITDAATDTLLQLVSINPSIQTVRLFRNNIVDRTPFQRDKRFEIW